MEIFNTILLAISGLLLFFVGMMRLINPIKTYSKNSGITIDDNVDLLNEVRGVSAVQLIAGVIILLGIFIPEWTRASFFVGSLIFIGFAIGRLLSMGMDGKPNKQIVQGLIFELVLGSLNSYVLLTSM